MQPAIFSITWISLSFFSGIVLARYYPNPAEVWFNLVIASAIIAFSAIILRAILERNSKIPPREEKDSSRTHFYFFLPLLFLSFFFGAYHFQNNQPDFDDPFYIGWYNDREYESLVSGMISKPPDYRDTYTNLTMDVEYLDQLGKAEPLEVYGKILVRVEASENYQYGDYIRVRGVLETPPENEEFSYKNYLALSDIHSYMRNAKATFLPEPRGGSPIKIAIYDLRDQALENIYKLFPDPEASLLAGILLGIETGLPADLQKAFKDTGTTHIIAISGFNITIIAGLFITLFGNLFGKKNGAIIAMIGIALYTILVGADSAVVRAALMGGLGLLGRQFGRRQDGIASLLFVSVVMAYFNPMVLWDVGFQLSFAATAGLILYAEPLANWFVRQTTRVTTEEKAEKIAGPIGEYILFTLAAQFATIPIMAYHFGQISLISFIANPFILPVQPAVMILGGIALIASLLIFPLGQLLAIFALPFTTYTIRAVEFFAQLPQGVIILGDTKLITVIIIYALMLTWTFAGVRLKKVSQSLKLTFIIAALTLLTVQVWRVAFAAPDERLHITFFDVGSADAILIQTPDGANILINGGERASVLSSELGKRLPPFHRELDWLIVASPQDEDLAALPRTLERFSPSEVLWSGNREASYASRDLQRYLTENEIPITYAETGHRLILGEKLFLEIQDSGTRGAVILIEWNSFRAFLPIGMDFKSLEESQEIGKVSLHLLTDSGYASINPPELIDALHPQLIILSVDAGDEFGLPHDSTLRAIEDYSLLRTDQNGWVHVSTDGIQMWVESER